MVDYVRALATARRLIAASGRLVNFEKFGATLLDPTKPLHGPDPDADPAPARVEGVYATFVPVSSLQQFGFSRASVEAFKNVYRTCIVAPDPTDADLSEFNRLEDYDNTLFISHVEVLKPGAITLLYAFALERTEVSG